jgi:hypothetical protein
MCKQTRVAFIKQPRTRKMEVEGWWMVHLRSDNTQQEGKLLYVLAQVQGSAASGAADTLPSKLDTARQAQQPLTLRSGQWMLCGGWPA